MSDYCTYPLIIRRKGAPELQFSLGRTGEETRGDYVILNAPIAGPNLPFLVQIFLGETGEVKVLGCRWWTWNLTGVYEERQFISPHFYGSGLTGEQKGVVRLWHENPEARPMPGMAGPSQALLKLAGVDDQPKAAPKEENIIPWVVSQGIIFPLINLSGTMSEQHTPTAIVALHGGGTIVYGFIKPGGVRFYYSQAGSNSSDFSFYKSNPTVNIDSKGRTLTVPEKRALENMLGKIKCSMKNVRGL